MWVLTFCRSLIHLSFIIDTNQGAVEKMKGRVNEPPKSWGAINL